jgi:hypothetical protein
MTWACNLLMQYHPMMGIDIHDALVPPSPKTIPMPHLVFACLKAGIWGVTPATLDNLTVKCTPQDAEVMSRGTDIGPFIPHIAPDLLAPLYTLTSASKSEFGAHSVKAPQGPVAVASSQTFNLNLNCAGASTPPLPSGFVLAPNTVLAGMTPGDFVAGLVGMVADSLVQFALNKLMGAAMAPLGDIVGGIVGSLLQTFGTGSPLGYSPSYTLLGGGYGTAMQAIQDSVQQHVDDYYNNPAVEQHPAAAPAPALP